MNILKINISTTEAQKRFFTPILHGVHKTTLLLPVGMPGIKYHPITGFQWPLQFQHHQITLNPRNFTQKNTALFSKSRMRQFLVVDPPEPAGIKAA